MPPLYKRYIPPKRSAAPSPAPAVWSSKQVQPPAANDEPKKRKRERTEDEVAERKAKKLRKKGIEPSDISQPNAAEKAKSKVKVVEKAQKSNGATLAVDNEPRTEFAHIKNTKKRHKLEKEARQARIAAEKASKEAAGNGTITSEPVLRSNTSRDKSQRKYSSWNDADEPLGPQEIQSIESKNKVKTRKNEVTLAEVVAEGTSETPSTNRNLQTPRKNREDHRGDEREGDDIEGLPLNDSTAGASKPAEAVSQPKKRRHTLEGILQHSNEHPTIQETDDDSRLKKHGSILKKYQKSAQLSQHAPTSVPLGRDPSEPEPVLLDLAPLPQPEPAPVEKFVPDDSALPSWLATPIVVSSDATAPFSSLELNPKAADHLSKLGFHDVLPVQHALIPLLLPPGIEGAQFLRGTESVLPDVAVDAPTGSGKTIAYLLPIIESLKASNRLVEGNLKALVVVPTRELVMQVAAVAESLAKGSTIKIGMSTGSGAFKDEQLKLVKQGRKYDPDGYRKLIAKADQRNYPPVEASEEFEKYLDELQDEDSKLEQRINDTVRGLIDHVPTYSSGVDILVATPGRLLDHIKSTLGFSLAHLDFLVLDEADKLLDLQYDGFLETVNSELERPRNEEEQNARERFLRAKGAWDERKERRVRKVVLSATMTRDISKLVALKLKRPSMIVVRGSEQQRDLAISENLRVAAGAAQKDGNSFELPPTLREYCIPIGDGSEKPLFLTELLRTKILNTSGSPNRRPVIVNGNDSPSVSEDSENTSSDPDSNPSSDPGSSLSDPDSEDTSEGDTSSESQLSTNDTQQQPEPENSMHPSRTAMLQTLSAPTVLIFTSSNESAARLSHFLKSLQPAWSAWIHTMTRTNSNLKLSSSNPNDPVIVISTDRAGRGLDALSTRQISHVVQYDVPRSLTAYVHRVGRTARAGRKGEAWTLYSHSEARWFFKEVAGKDFKGVKRVGEVERVRIRIEDDDGSLRDRLAEVVDGVRGAVFGVKR